jgi:TonB family protein
MFKALGPSRIAPRASRHRAFFLAIGLLAAAAVTHAQQPAPDSSQQPASPATLPAPPNPDQAAPPTAQTPPSPAAAAPPAQEPVAGQVPTEAPVPTAPQLQDQTKAEPAPPGSITEEELKQQLVGKQFYLRGGYLGDTLAFDEHGKITGHSPQGSYTLSVIQIDHVRLTKHKVDLEGARFGLHFNEQLAYEDASSAYDKVRITPKKKVVRISIDREMVVNPKKKKESAKEKAKSAKSAASTTIPAPAPAASAADPAPAPESASGSPASPPSDSAEPSEADQLKASIAATPEAERPADPTAVTTTTSQAHANGLLRNAINAVLAPGLDDRMMAAMPDFWKLYYQSVAAKADYRPADASVLRQNNVDQKARLLTSFEPDSNDFAQTAGVAGMALYHTVIGPDGKPGEIAVARPIGFGLDENAVAAIRKAKFSPAIKNGQPVPVMLDLVVQFRIFSRRTGATGPLPDLAQQAAPPPANPDQTATGKPADAPVLPGPYSVPHPVTSPPASQPNN